MARMSIRILILAAIMVLSPGCSGRALLTISVSGTITDVFTHEPVANASVNLGNNVAVTNAAGQYSMIGVKVNAPTAVIRFEATGYAAMWWPISVSDGGSYSISAELLRMGSSGPGNTTITGLATLVNAQAYQSSSSSAMGLVPFKSAREDRRIPGEPGEAIITPRTGTKHAAISAGLQALGSAIARASLQDGFITASIPKGMRIEDFVSILNGLPWVESASPNHTMVALNTPNDPYFTGYQWNLQAISLSEAWKDTTGYERPVVVAVLDTGIRPEHPDLMGKIVPGWDFVSDDNDATDILLDGRVSHGTHVSGIIGAQTNNGIGVAGVSWGVMLMPVRVLDSFGFGHEDKLVSAINWAVDNGAHVINMSLGFTGASFSPSLALQNAIVKADKAGVTLVAAAGNSGTGIVDYPARHPAVVAVSATGRFNELAAYSSYGMELDVCAPGGNRIGSGGSNADMVLSTSYTLQSSNGYYYMQGTSMAAPHVTGLAALIRSRLNITSAQAIRDIVRSTAMDIGPPGWDMQFGYGLINAHAAVNQATMDRAIFAILDSQDQVISDIGRGALDRSFSISNAPSGSQRLLAWLDLPPYGIMDDHDYVGIMPITIPDSGTYQIQDMVFLDRFERIKPSVREAVTKVDLSTLIQVRAGHVQVRRER